MDITYFDSGMTLLTFHSPAVTRIHGWLRGEQSELQQVQNDQPSYPYDDLRGGDVVPQRDHAKQADRGQSPGIGRGALVQHDAASRALQRKVEPANPVGTVLPQGEGYHVFYILWGWHTIKYHIQCQIPRPLPVQYRHI